MYNKDEILGFETDTVWGMGCSPNSEIAVNKIYEFKGRDRSKPLILMSDKIENLLPYVKNIPPYANDLIEKFFPGAITLIFEKTEKCPDYITSNFDTVGIRIPNHKGFYEIIENTEEKVLATTSLNLSGMPPCKDYNEAILNFGGKINVIKPKNEKQNQGVASTVVLCKKNAPLILRQGSIFINF